MIAALVAAAVGAGLVANSLPMGIFTLTALAVSVWRLWVPVTFEFGADGIVQTCWNRRRRIPWPQLARYEVLPRGVLLSADTERSILSPLRSIYVRCDQRRDELVQILEYFKP